MTSSRGDVDVGPVGHAHDGVDDAEVGAQELEVLGLVGRAEHVGVGRVGLVGAHRVGLADPLEVLAHLLAAAELVDEPRVEPRLVDAQPGVDEDAVAEEPLDVVALVGGAVAEDVDIVLAHRLDDRGGGDRPAQGRRVEVLPASAGEVEGTALDRDQAFADHRLAAIDEARAGCSVIESDRRDLPGIVLIGLGQVGGVAVDLHPLLAHPGDSGAGIEPAREGETDLGARLGQLAVDTAHGAADDGTTGTDLQLALSLRCPHVILRPPMPKSRGIRGV